MQEGERGGGSVGTTTTSTTTAAASGGETKGKRTLVTPSASKIPGIPAQGRA